MSFDFVSTGIELPDNWKLTRIGDVAEVNPDTIKKKDEPTEIFYLDISSVSTGQYETPGYMKYIDAPSRAKRRLKPNDFIISTVRPNLRQFAMLEEVGENWVASTGFCVVRAKEARTAWYLYSFITSGLFNEHLVRVADGAAYPSFNPKEIEDAVIPWPADDDLYAINHFAKIINNKVELNRQTNQTLEQIAQAIFKSWFVDFEPVKAKIAALEAGGSEDDALLAAMQAIASSALFATDVADADAQTQLARLQTEHPEQYATLRATAELFPSAMQESELGEIPEGWTTKEIKALSTKISKGSTPRKSDLQNAEDPELIEFLKVRDLSDEGEIARTGLDKIPKSVHSGVLKRSILEADDILFSIAGTIGRVAVIEEELSDSNCNQALAFIRLAEPLKYLELCRLNLVGSRVQNEVVSKVVQGVQANFSLASLGEILIVIPLDGVLYEFNNTVTKFSKKRKELMTEVRVLAELRDTLLPKLLSGELSLAATEEQLADTVEPAHV